MHTDPTPLTDDEQKLVDAFAATLAASRGLTVYRQARVLAAVATALEIEAELTEVLRSLR